MAEQVQAKTLTGKELFDVCFGKHCNDHYQECFRLVRLTPEGIGSELENGIRTGRIDELWLVTNYAIWEASELIWEYCGDELQHTYLLSEHSEAQIWVDSPAPDKPDRLRWFADLRGLDEQMGTMFYTCEDLGPFETLKEAKRAISEVYQAALAGGHPKIDYH